MRIVLLIGNNPNQTALAAKVAKQFKVVGIVLQKKKSSKKKKNSPNVFQKIMERVLFFQIHSAWNAMMKHYRKYFPHLPVVPILETEKINTQEVFDFIQQKNADVIMVSGTTMVKEPLLSLKPTIGIINLHTGFSPYVKGGPNCTNWCLSNGTPHLIGNTIMWIDAGIDSGNIITSELTEFTGNESFSGIHLKVMEHAHELYMDALRALEKDKTTVPNVAQNEIAEGKTFYTRDWNFKAKMNLLKYISTNKFGQQINIEAKKNEVKEVKLK